MLAGLCWGNDHVSGICVFVLLSRLSEAVMSSSGVSGMKCRLVCEFPMFVVQVLSSLANGPGLVWRVVIITYTSSLIRPCLPGDIAKVGCVMMICE